MWFRRSSRCAPQANRDKYAAPRQTRRPPCRRPVYCRHADCRCNSIPGRKTVTRHARGKRRRMCSAADSAPPRSALGKALTRYTIAMLPGEASGGGVRLQVLERQMPRIQIPIAQDAHQQFGRKIVGNRSQAHAQHHRTRRHRQRPLPAAGSPARAAGAAAGPRSTDRAPTPAGGAGQACGFHRRWPRSPRPRCCAP